MVAGFLGDGVAVPEDLDGILISVEAETVFQEPARSGTSFRGRLPEQGLDGSVHTALGRLGAREALVLPVAVRGRVINLLYADVSHSAFGETDVAALAALCGCIGGAYEQLVIQRKRAIA
jgi:hypothetical protein